jgi:DeoR/GlpR family transcriptional regulator of sugar metabolism
MGLETIETFRQVRADLCFLGVCSIHFEIGLSVPNREEAQVKRAMIAASAQAIALATTEKIGTAEAYVVDGLQSLDILITDMAPASEMLNLYREKGVEVL